MATDPSDISAVNALSQLGLAQKTATQAPNKEVGQSEFFELMLAQLKFQDPLKPLNNTEFVSQMAQFSSVDSLSTIEDSMGQLISAFQSNQALQASTLVGRDVLVSGSKAQLGSRGTVTGAVENTTSAENVAIRVLDGTGALVRRIELGASGPGQLRFQWDGKSEGGETLAPGTYQFQADASTPNGSVGLEVLVPAKVESVSVRRSPPGVTLDVAGVGAIDLNEIRALL